MSTITQFPTGSTQYRIEFDYLARPFVVVTLINSSDPNDSKLLTVGNDYRFMSKTMIEVLANQEGYDIIRIQRQTSTSLIVSFQDGSVLTANDLSAAELQAIHIAEEGRDQTVDLAKEYADAARKSADDAGSMKESIEDIVSNSGWDSKLRSDLGSSTIPGASIVRTSRGNTVESETSWSYFGVTVNVMDYPSLKAAINALPVFGGRVIVPTGNYFVGDYDAATDYMSKPNVTIIGSAMPRPNSDASALVGGSVLEGRFNACANGLTVINVGFDMGKAVREKYWPGVDTAVEYLRGGTWDAFSHGQPSQSSPVGGTVGFHLENVIGLCEKSETIGHAVLIENVVEGYCDNVVGVYGVHGVVIKSANMRIGSIAGYMAKVDNVIFKSDSYAAGGNIQVDSVIAMRHYPNVTPHSAPAKAMAGIYFNPETQHFTGPISIGKLHCSGAENAILCANADSGKVGGDIKIGLVDVDTDVDFALFSSNFGEFPRLYIDVLTVKNAKSGIYVNWPKADSSGQIQTAIGTLNAYQIESNAIIAGGYARLHIDNVNIYGAGTAYYATENSRMTVGVEHITGASSKWSIAPSLGAGWTNEGGINSDFDVYYSGGKVCLKGLLRSAAGAGTTVIQLPAFLRPTKTHRFIALYSASVCSITVLPSGAVVIGNVVPAADTFLSLEGISWTL